MRVTRLRFMLAMFVVLALTATACGSDAKKAATLTTTAAGGVSSGGDYKAQLQEFMAPVTSYDALPKSPAPAKNKHIVIVSCCEAAEGSARITAAAKKAAEEFGWTTELIDGKGDPALWQAAIEQAIQKKADGIFLAAINEATVTEQLKAARAAGIVVGGGRGGSVPSDTGENFELTANDERQGTMAGTYAVVATSGKARIAVFDDKEFVVVKTMLDGAKKVIASCLECKIVADETFLATELVDRLPQLTSSVLSRNPEVNFILSAFDAAFNFQVEALAADGITQPKVLGVSFDGNRANLENVRSKKTVQSASVAVAYGFMGYAAMDNFNRIFQGGQPVKFDTPVRLFTNENIGDTAVWDTDFDYASQFRKSWGL